MLNFTCKQYYSALIGAQQNYIQFGLKTGTGGHNGVRWWNNDGDGGIDKKTEDRPAGLETTGAALETKLEKQC